MPDQDPLVQDVCSTKRKRFDNNPKSDVLMLTQKSRGQSIMRKSGFGLRGTAQWESIMRSFSTAHKETCRYSNMPKDLPETHRDLKKFPTGSTYAGTWNVLGMNGQGTYTFPHGGVVYKGGFYDGMFHGDGELQYECGAVIKGKWNKGQLVDRHLFFADGLEYVEDNWAYCRPSDRRFTIEYDEGLAPAGRSYLTAEQPTVPIPPGFYDVGDGYYDPITKLVYKYNDLTGIERAPTQREQEWILTNCRKNPDSPVGPCPFLYEEWNKPTLELPTIPQPEIHQDEDDFDYHNHVSRTKASRGHLFTSRIGLCSTTDFYTPGRDGVGIELKGISAHKLKKTSSVAFKVPKISSTTVTVKDHEQLSDSKISDWGLTDNSTTKQSISSSLHSDLPELHPKDEKLDVRADTSNLLKSASLIAVEEGHAKVRKSKHDNDEHDIERSITSIKSKLSVRMLEDTINQQPDHKEEINLDHKRKQSKTLVDQHKHSVIKIERSETKPRLSLTMPIRSTSDLSQLPDKEEVTIDPIRADQHTPSNIKIEKSETKPQLPLKQPDYKEEATFDSEIKKSHIGSDQYKSNDIKIYKPDTEQQSSLKMAANPPDIDEQPDHKEEATFKTEIKKSETGADQLRSSNIKIEPGEEIINQV